MPITPDEVKQALTDRDPGFFGNLAMGKIPYSVQPLPDETGSQWLDSLCKEMANAANTAEINFPNGTGTPGCVAGLVVPGAYQKGSVDHIFSLSVHRNPINGKVEADIQNEENVAVRVDGKTYGPFHLVYRGMNSLKEFEYVRDKMAQQLDVPSDKVQFADSNHGLLGPTAMTVEKTPIMYALWSEKGRYPGGNCVAVPDAGAFSKCLDQQISDTHGSDLQKYGALNGAPGKVPGSKREEATCYTASAKVWEATYPGGDFDSGKATIPHTLNSLQWVTARLPIPSGESADLYAKDPKSLPGAFRKFGGEEFREDPTLTRNIKSLPTGWPKKVVMPNLTAAELLKPDPSKQLSTVSDSPIVKENSKVPEPVPRL